MSGPAASISAQAKLNLYLRVLAREDSGYHSIETVFHRIDHADDLTIRIEEDDRRTLDVKGSDLGPVESNLAYRAAVAYQDRAGWPAGFTIELDKHIAPGGGLGGGSADAAAVLLTLESLARTPLGEPLLLMIATELGADVPFLVGREVMALAWGHGERTLALAPLPQRDVLLVTPDFRVSSADAYAWLDEDRASISEESRYGNADLLLASEDLLASWEALAGFSRNDFIGPVAARHPQIPVLLKALGVTGALFTSMTGSGSTLFAIYERLPDMAVFSGLGGVKLTSTRTAVDVVQPIRIG